MRCLGYNHKSTECRNDETCYKLHGQHKTRECNKEIKKKIINCIRANIVLKLNRNDDHYTNDKKCPVYENTLSLKKQHFQILNYNRNHF